MWNNIKCPSFSIIKTAFDSKYILHGITGMLDYSDVKNCFKKQKKIIEDFILFFNQRPEEYTVISEYDKTGQSKVYYAEWYPDRGRVQIICYDFANTCCLGV